MTKKVPLKKLIADRTFQPRFGTDADAIERYVEMYQAGHQKALKVQAGTLRIVDGFHRHEAARRAGVDAVIVEELDVPDHQLRQTAYSLNAAHGVPLSRAERNQLICDLYSRDGMTQAQVADLVGLARNTITEIIGSVGNRPSDNGGNNGKNGDKRKTIADKDWPAIVRQALAGEKQTVIAKARGVSQSTIAEGIARFKNNLLEAYTGGQRKAAVAEKFGLTTSEADTILAEFGDPLNFVLPYHTVWTGGRDPEFGVKHPGNLPAMIAQNLFALFTKPGDLILDPCCGGGMTLDVAADMVNRACVGYDLHPTRPDIRKHDISDAPPKLDRAPDFVFLDPPYGPQKQGEYSDNPKDLSNKDLAAFCTQMGRIFGYWTHGRIAVCMSSFRHKARFYDLPVIMADLMRTNGWQLIEHIISVYNEPASETGFWIESARKNRWLMRKHLHILVGEHE